MSKIIPPNPYYDFTAIRDPSRFFGREDQIRQLLEACDKKQSTSVTGSRHIGRTSLLNHLMSPVIHQKWGYHLKLQRHIFISVDPHDYLDKDKTHGDFFDTVCRQICAQAQQRVPSLKLANCSGGDQLFQLLEDLDGAGFHTVLLFDAIDKIINNRQFNPNFFVFLRSLAGRGWVSYITASIKPLYELEKSRPEVGGSPFFTIFATCRLGPLTSGEAQQLITTLASTAATPSFFTLEDTQWIIEQAGCHPFFLQVTCRYLFDQKCKQGDVEVDFEYVRERIYEELAAHFDQLWNDLTPEQQADLKQELRQQRSTQYKFPELSESSLFRKRIQEKFHIDLFDISCEEVKKASKKLDDLAFLQTCKLAETHYVAVRGKHDNAFAYKKGKLVLDFLKGGFERMRPSGMRSDLAPEWRYYNILYYCYFQHHLGNEHTAARLTISLRTFYREQEKAFEILTEVLRELERSSLDEGEK